VHYDAPHEAGPDRSDAVNVVDAVYLLCAAQGLLVFALLWARRQNRTANRLLGLAILAIAVSSVYVLYLRTGFFERHPRWLFAIDTLPALYGPLFYLYTRALSGQPVARPAPHFIPFALYTLVELPRLFMGPDAKLETFLAERNSGGSDLQLAASLAFDLLGLCYFVAALLHVQRYRRSLAGRFSNFDRISLRWLFGLLWVLLVLWVGSMAGYVSEHSLLVYVHASLGIVMYAIAYLNVAQPQIFAGPLEDRPSLVPPPAALGLNDAVAAEWSQPPPPPTAAGSDSQPPAAEPGLKYLKARLKPEQARLIAERIEQLFAAERPYLDPELALTGLAERLDVPPHHVSQVLNEHFTKSFYDFVNGYRVEELKRRLRDPEHAQDKILSLGLDCGFSTKSTLNANFRKHAGMTPRAYREQPAAAP
jgi:AraC-like DNA-binding protein